MAKKTRAKALRIFLIICAIAAAIVGLWYFYSLYNMPKQTQSSESQSHVSVPQSKRYWIISTAALNDVVANSSARSMLAADTIFVPGKQSELVSSATSGLHIIPTETFTSESDLASTLKSNTIDPSTKAILYDNEDWQLTPAKEQSNPVLYYKKAAALVHSRGYIFVGTPVSKTHPNITVEIAPYVDVLDIQSQYDQAVAATYSSHVTPLAKAASQANPSVIILSGLSTNPSAGIPTPQQLIDDAHAVWGAVKGYWLNIPSPGTACPKCYAAQPQIGIDFLNGLGAV